MILVVYSHVCGFCFGDSWMAFNDILFLLRLPAFFFISGLLFEPVRGTLAEVAVRKMRSQLLPTLIFLLLLAPPPVFFSQLGATKGGYWFTFALFEFFMLYMLTGRRNARWGLAAALFISFAAYYYDACYNHSFRHIAWLRNTMGGLSFITWRYYIFFFAGTMAKRHLCLFLKLTSKPFVLATLATVFAAVAMTPRPTGVLTGYVWFVVGGLSGLSLLFTAFRAMAPVLTKVNFPGMCLQFIGRRTLDIYLLHYFLLPRFLLPYGEPLRSLHCIPAEAAIVLGLSLVVVAVCLLVSHFLRKSPFLARYLFGAQSSSASFLS